VSKEIDTNLAKIIEERLSNMELVAEGRVVALENFVGEKGLSQINNDIKKYNGKKIKIWVEVKE
jgi:hypothetical protein